MAKDEPPPTKPCDLCDGTGTLMTPLPDGKGWTESNCPDCQGSGRVPA